MNHFKKVRKYEVYGLYVKEHKIKYIGITSRGLNVRLLEHIRDAVKNKNNSYKDNWIRKQIKNNEEIKILKIDEIVSNRLEAQNLEQYYINYYSDCEQLINCSFDLNNTSNYSKTKEKEVVLIDRFTGKKITTFPSVKAASLFLNKNKSFISSCARISGKKKCCSKYIYVYKKDYNSENKYIVDSFDRVKDSKKRMTKSKKAKMIKASIESRMRKVKQIKDGVVIKIHSSMKKAALYVGGNQSNIYKVCNGLRNHHKGFKWEYCEDIV